MTANSIQTGTCTTRQSGSQPKRMSSLVLYRIVKGRTRWSVDGKSCLLREGDILLILPGQVFSGAESSESVLVQLEWIEIRVCEGSKRLTGTALARALRCDPADARFVVGALGKLDSPVLRPEELFSRLFSRVVSQPPLPGGDEEGIFLRASVWQILTSLSCRDPVREMDSAATRSDAESDVALFLSELESRCEEAWTLESMAAGADLKRSRFGALCRKLTGESPAVYLNRLRIRRSRRLLRDTDHSITEIAFACGFSSSQYFAKTFRRFQGHEPTHYRKLAQDMSLGRGIQYFKGDSARNVAFAKEEIGRGDFEVSGVLMLDRLGDTAASLEFGPDRFGFDGREGCFFLEGETFGEACFFNRSAEVIREGEFFSFTLKRRKRILSVEIKDRAVVSIPDDPQRPVGKIGLRPLRNGIRVQEFALNGEAVDLRVVSN